MPDVRNLVCLNLLIQAFTVSKHWRPLLHAVAINCLSEQFDLGLHCLLKHKCANMKGKKGRKKLKNGQTEIKWTKLTHSPLDEFCHLLITFANSLDPDQVWQNVGPDLDPNCLTLWWHSWKIFFEKANFEKRIHKKHANLPSMQRVNNGNEINMPTNYFICPSLTGKAISTKVDDTLIFFFFFREKIRLDMEIIHMKGQILFCMKTTKSIWECCLLQIHLAF